MQRRKAGIKRNTVETKIGIIIINLKRFFEKKKEKKKKPKRERE